MRSLEARCNEGDFQIQFNPRRRSVLIYVPISLTGTLRAEVRARARLRDHLSERLLSNDGRHTFFAKLSRNVEVDIVGLFDHLLPHFTGIIAAT